MSPNIRVLQGFVIDVCSGKRNIFKFIVFVHCRVRNALTSNSIGYETTDYEMETSGTRILCRLHESVAFTLG